MRQQSVRAEAGVESCGGQSERWPVWMSAVLCTFFVHRRSKLYNSGDDEKLHSQPAPHRFAQTGLRRASLMHEAGSYRSQASVEEQSNLSAASSALLAASKPKTDLSWGIPWVYLAFLLLAWLFLL